LSERSKTAPLDSLFPSGQQAVPFAAGAARAAMGQALAPRSQAMPSLAAPTAAPSHRAFAFWTILTRRRVPQAQTPAGRKSLPPASRDAPAGAWRPAAAWPPVAVATPLPGDGMGEFHAVFERSTLGMAQLELESGRFRRANPRFCEILGFTAAEMLGGLCLPDLAPAGAGDSEPAAFRATLSREGVLAGEWRLRRKDGAILHLQMDCALAGTLPGEPAQVFLLVQDITERRALAERQSLLVREMEHRAKNLLAVVQCIIRLTREADLKGTIRAIEGRIGAVARAHSLLSAERCKQALLEPLVREELAPYGPRQGDLLSSRITIAGPPVPLAPDAVQPLAMALHELATNAAKYGALSGPEGRVSVIWELLPADRLRLRWQERGGPPASPPGTRRGFGTRVITGTIGEQLGGTALMDWAPEGLCCDITIPAAHGLAGQRPGPRASAAG
jgi:PAS domain S-box-containing protein